MLVQREMEGRHVPLASIIPIPSGQFAPLKAVNPHGSRSYWANAPFFRSAPQFRMTFKGSGLVAISLVRNRWPSGATS